MSMSTGDVRQPSAKLSTKAVAADGKKPEAKAAPSKVGGAKPAAKKSGGKSGPAKAGGGKGRKPVTPVKVNSGPNWGPILMFGGSGLVALLIVGFGAFQLIKEANKPGWQERAAEIPGISLFLTSNPDWFKAPAEGNHKPGPLTYPSAPPVGGVHNGKWQNCMGDVYPAEIAKEHAVHSLEHGAVWITYRPDLPKDQVDELADKVNGKSYLFMSPFPNQDKPISLQAWGYQLKVDNADDDRIDEFIASLRENAAIEKGATCSTGITDTTTVPIDLPESE